MFSSLCSYPVLFGLFPCVYARTVRTQIHWTPKLRHSSPSSSQVRASTAIWLAMTPRYLVGSSFNLLDKGGVIIVAFCTTGPKGSDILQSNLLLVHFRPFAFCAKILVHNCVLHKRRLAVDHNAYFSIV